MVRVRKLVLAIAAASALSSGSVHALGLGEINLQSSLSQPLVAEIELLEVRDLASNEVIPTLASPEDFNSAGVERQYFLTDLKFTPVIKANGKSVIRVTSNKPVREPYLNFLVEVLWPNGRLLREYTLLLDPPTYAPSPVVVSAPRLPVAASAPVARPAVAARPATPAAPVRSASVAPAVASSAAKDQYRTDSRDTLWEIAQAHRQSGSVHQAMLAIQDLNPNAFIDGNINRLKSGQVLRMPTAEQINARSRAEAQAQVAAQNTAWREGRSLASAGARQLDATKRDSAAAAPARTEVKDNLTLVAAGDSKAQSGSDSAQGNIKALENELAVTKESLDSSKRENTELQGRMQDLQSQVEKLERLIELKDSNLARLQQDLQAQQAQAVVAPEPAVAAEVAPSVEAQAEVVEAPAAVAETQEAVIEAQIPATADAPAQTEIAAEVVEPVAPVEPVAEAEIDYNYVESEPAPVVEPVAEPVAEVGEAEVVATEPQASQPGLVEKVMADPMLLGAVGGGAILALLLALMAISRRNAKREEESLRAHEADPVYSKDEQDDAFAGLADDAFDSADLDADDEPVTAQTSDVLSEAEIYIAYGKFAQAAELLENAIEQEPERTELRVKLLEVYAEMGDREGFGRQEQELAEVGQGRSAVDSLKAKFPAMAGAAVAAAALTEADDLDFADLDFSDVTVEPAAASATQESSALADDFDLGFEAELESTLAQPSVETAPSFEEDLIFTAPEPEPVAGNDLDFSLALDAEMAPAAPAEAKDDFADFALDLNEQPVAQAEMESALDVEEQDFLLSLNEEPVVEVAEPALDTALELPDDFDLSVAEDAVPSLDESSFSAELESVSSELDDLNLSFQETVAPAVEAAPVSSVSMDDDFDFLSGTDETSTKLDLARAYIDMGDSEGARDILDEVVNEGSESQQQEARELIAKLS